MALPHHHQISIQDWDVASFIPSLLALQGSWTQKGLLLLVMSLRILARAWAILEGMKHSFVFIAGLFLMVDLVDDILHGP